MSIRLRVPWIGESFKVQLLMNILFILPYCLFDIVWFTLIDRNMDIRIIVLLIALFVAEPLIAAWIGYIVGKPYRSQINIKPSENIIIKYALWEKWDFKSICVYMLMAYTLAATGDAIVFLPIEGKGAGQAAAEIALFAACLVLVSTLFTFWYGRCHTNQLNKQIGKSYNDD